MVGIIQREYILSNALESIKSALQFLNGYTYTLDGKKAAALKQLSQEKKFSVKLAEDIITGRYFKKPAKKATTIKLAYKSLSNYVDTSLSQKEVEEYILKALEFYKQNVS